jgi:hypothetical protein
MSRLTVDEIEEDGSGMFSNTSTDMLKQRLTRSADWENSVASSEQIDSLADLSMQTVRDM